jgi:hypothetical protein
MCLYPLSSAKATAFLTSPGLDCHVPDAQIRIMTLVETLDTRLKGSKLIDEEKFVNHLGQGRELTRQCSMQRFEGMAASSMLTKRKCEQNDLECGNLAEISQCIIYFTFLACTQLASWRILVAHMAGRQPAKVTEYVRKPRDAAKQQKCGILALYRLTLISSLLVSISTLASIVARPSNFKNQVFILKN